MDEYATALVDAIEKALPLWVERKVIEMAHNQMPDIPTALESAAHDAGERAKYEIAPRIRALLEKDVDEQATTPLALLREAVAFPTAVLSEAGIQPVARDDFARARFPDDVYDLTPANFGDIDSSLSDPGLAWGAAKAFAHKQRHGTSRAQS